MAETGRPVGAVIVEHDCLIFAESGAKLLKSPPDCGEVANVT
jgi:hypothetical protein